LLAISRWRQASQRVVRSDFVVPLDPFGGDVADLVQRVEQVATQDFLAVGPVEALDVGVLVRLARLDEADLDALLTCLGNFARFIPGKRLVVEEWIGDDGAA
jgi:hypothetical protein